MNMDRFGELTGNSERLICKGGEAFLCEGTGTGWMVMEGAVDLFLCRSEHGVPSGIRKYYFSAGPGEIILPLPSNGNKRDLRLLANPGPGAVLAPFSLSLLQEHLTDPVTGESSCALLEQWIMHLATGLAIGPAGFSAGPVRVGKPVTWNANAIIQSRKTLYWIEIVKGTLVFMGMNEMDTLPDSSLLPVVGDIFFQTAEKAEVRFLPTVEAVRRKGFWQELGQFYAVLSGYLQIKEQFDRVDELNLLVEKADHLSSTRSESFYRIAAVINDKVRRKYLYRDEDPMLTACRQVGKRSGIVIRKPVKPRQEEPQPFTLNDIVHASRFKTRRVRLEHLWWKNASGSLLAFTVKDNCPVALVQTGSGAYLYQDPRLGAGEAMNEALAATLQPIAIQFYRPMPDTVMTGKELLLFGISSCYRELFIICLVAMGAALLNLLLPFFSGFLFDQVIPYDGYRLVYLTGAILVLAAIAVTLFQVMRSISMIRIETKLDFVYQSAIWDRLLKLPVKFFRSFTSGELAMKTNSVLMMRKVLSETVIYTMIGSVVLLFNLIYLFWYDPVLGCLSAGTLFLTFLIIGLIGIPVQRLQSKQINIHNRLSGLVTQVLTSITKIKTTGAESKAFELWADRFVLQRKNMLSRRKLNILVSVLIAVSPVVTLTLVFYRVYATGLEKISTGEFMTFITALTMLTLAVNQAARAYIEFRMAVPLYDNIKMILNTLPENHLIKPECPPLSGAIDVTNLSYRYGEKEPLALKNITFHVNPGEFVAVVGRSGSGKSTLMKLLLGFDQPETGTISYDHHDLAMVNPESVRRQIGSVLQTSQLFPGTVFTNIAGVTDATADDVFEAAAMAGLKEDIHEMPMGMFTAVSEGISTLSGGQRQRILIARALVNHPRILIFDEATSALDNVTQQRISATLRDLDATKIVIAHRLSTVVHADRIYVLEAGEIAESGTYQELISSDGKFTQLVKRQMIG